MFFSLILGYRIIFQKEMKISKTNAARLLDKAKIPYELIPYKVDENHLAASHVAEQLGEDICSVFKTLVLQGDKNGYFVCVIPGDQEVNLKLAAQISGNKKAELIPMKELLPVTGYIRGGCSPIGMKKPFPVLYTTAAWTSPTSISVQAYGVCKSKFHPNRLSGTPMHRFVHYIESFNLPLSGNNGIICIIADKFRFFPPSSFHVAFTSEASTEKRLNGCPYPGR